MAAELTGPDFVRPDALGVGGTIAHVLSGRRIAVRCGIAAGVVAGLVGLLLPRTWTARASFVAQAGREANLGQLAGLASQFGVNIAGAMGSNGYQPRFFATLITTDEVLGVVADRRYSATATDSVALAEELGVEGRTPGERRQRTIRKLRRDVVSATYDQRNGLTTLLVRTQRPELSLAIANDLIAEINRFNTERHQSRASAERQFIQGRRDEIGNELRSAEAALTAFLRTNRSYDASPERAVEADRLRRRVGELQALLAGLNQSYESARIEEVRDTPVLTLVERPDMPALPDERSLVQWVIAATVLGVLACLVWQVLGVLVGSPTSRRGVPPPSLTDEVRNTLADFRRPWSLLRRDRDN